MGFTWRLYPCKFAIESKHENVIIWGSFHEKGTQYRPHSPYSRCPEKVTFDTWSPLMSSFKSCGSKSYLVQADGLWLQALELR